MQLLRLLNRMRGRDLPTQITLDVPKEKIGSSYGGYCVAVSDLNEKSVVYSFGVGEDISFDLGIIERFGIEVHAFDPTPKSIAWITQQKLPRGFYFHPVGLGANDEQRVVYGPPKENYVSHSIVERRGSDRSVQVPLKRLSTLMNEIGHDRLAILKVDIEGAEYEVLEDILASDTEIDQILIEFHHHFGEIPIEKTSTAISRLQQAGYGIIDISRTGREYAFLRI